MLVSSYIVTASLVLTKGNITVLMVLALWFWNHVYTKSETFCLERIYAQSCQFDWAAVEQS